MRSPKEFYRIHLSVKPLLSIRELGKSASCYSSKIFFGKLEKTDKRSFHFEGGSGVSIIPYYQNPFNFFPIQKFKWNRRNRFLYTRRQKTCWEVSLFLVAKKTQDTVQWSILKSWISTFHKNASKRKVYFFWRNSPEERLYVQNLKDVYCAVPLHSSSQKYIKFKWKWNLYQFLRLCFCLSSARKVFSKGILKIPISIM